MSQVPYGLPSLVQCLCSQKVVVHSVTVTAKAINLDFSERSHLENGLPKLVSEKSRWPTQQIRTARALWTMKLKQLE